ncbi:hypothetical protein Btru_044641 [Bulinus truncatus]|nr:hypothetical protein Btru_044641 [Bulinus truncatus]
MNSVSLFIPVTSEGIREDDSQEPHTGTTHGDQLGDHTGDYTPRPLIGTTHMDNKHRPLTGATLGDHTQTISSNSTRMKKKQLLAATLKYPANIFWERRDLNRKPFGQVSDAPTSCHNTQLDDAIFHIIEPA